jgi:hypothetical protein
MSEPVDALRLVIELEPGAKPIHGTVTDGGGQVREYVGWLALISALEELSHRAPEKDPCGVSPSP